MAIGNTNVELIFNDVVADVAIDVNIDTFDKAYTVVTYGNSRLETTRDVDYTVALDNEDDLDPVFPTKFKVTPLAALITKINDLIASTPGEVNTIQVSRLLPVTNDFVTSDAFARDLIVAQFDKATMIAQQQALGIAKNAAAVAAIVTYFDNVYAQIEAARVAALEDIELASEAEQEEIEDYVAAQIIIAQDAITAAKNVAIAAVVAQQTTSVNAVNAAGVANKALTAADVVLTHADVVSTHADVVSTHADVTTTNTNKNTATTQAGIATTQAGIATTQAGIATTQAGIATGVATTLSDLAEGIAGGTTDQVLTKNSPTDYDYKWSDPDTVGTPFVGTDGSIDGAAGLVPSPLVAAFRTFLASNGKWKHVNEDVYLDDVLVLGDPLAAAANTAAIEDVLDWLNARGGGNCVLPRGTIYHEGITKTGLKGICIRGASPVSYATSTAATLLVQTNLSGAHIELTDMAGCSVEDLTLGYNGTPTGGACIKFHATDGAHIMNNIRRCVIDDHWNGFDIQAPITRISDCTLYRGKGDFGIGMFVPGELEAVDMIWLDRCTVANETAGGHTTYEGLSIQGIHTVWANNCNFLLCKNAALIGTNALFVRLTNCDFENSHNSGVFIDTGTKIWIENCYSSVNYGSGIETSGNFAGVLWIRGNTIVLNAFHGIVLQGTGNHHTEISGNQIGGNSSPARGGTANSAHGIAAIAGVGNLIITGNRSGGVEDSQSTGTQAYGCWLAGSTADNIIIRNNSFIGNSTGSLSDGSTGAHKDVGNNIV